VRGARPGISTDTDSRHSQTTLTTWNDRTRADRPRIRARIRRSLSHRIVGAFARRRAAGRRARPRSLQSQDTLNHKMPSRRQSRCACEVIESRDPRPRRLRNTRSAPTAERAGSGQHSAAPACLSSGSGTRTVYHSTNPHVTHTMPCKLYFLAATSALALAASAAFASAAALVLAAAVAFSASMLSTLSLTCLISSTRGA